jgi:hypothetical protein
MTCSNNTTCKHNSAYPQLSVKIRKLERSNKKLKHAARSASTIPEVIAKIPTHLEVMGPVALENV